jgi:hypothetical protein
MNVTKRDFAIFCTAVFLAINAANALAQQTKDAKSASTPEAKLPPGWTAEDMKAFMSAATPGKMHTYLAQDVGVWHGKNTMWMAPGTPPIESKSTSTVTSMLDGRYIKLEVAGDMPGMGPYNGFAITGYDNVGQKFTSTWIDNMGTGMSIGEGELSSDRKVLTWNYTVNCPIQKKPVVMRQVETLTGPGAKTIEMFGPDPKTGKEYKSMRIELTKVK